MKSVSVVIPCYNHGKYLAEAIESALGQTVKPLEIIVVDDGSTDNTMDVSKSFPVKYIRIEHGGVSKARNTGIKSSQGTHILTLDADDKLYKDSIERALSCSSDIVVLAAYFFGSVFGEWQFKSKNYTFEDLLKNSSLFYSSVFPKKTWEKIGGYDENMEAGEDWDFLVRLLHSGCSVERTEKPAFFYRKHGHSLSEVSKKNHEAIKAYINAKFSKEVVR